MAANGDLDSNKDGVIIRFYNIIHFAMSYVFIPSMSYVSFFSMSYVSFLACLMCLSVSLGLAFASLRSSGSLRSPGRRP